MTEHDQLRRRTVFVIAWPIILSNLATPLLGLVDTAVIGNLGDPALIGAIAVGATIFSFLFWGFGFLRMGTTGLVAQASGAADAIEVKAVFYRALLTAVVIGVALIAAQNLLVHFALGLFQGSEAVESAALTYFQIRIWAAPFSLILLVCLGYLLGHQNSKAILVIQLLLNGTNIILDIIFVVGLDWGVVGIAAATVMAEVLAALVAMVIAMLHLNRTCDGWRLDPQRLGDLPRLLKTFSVSRDIMIRTLCLIFAFAWFTNEGAKAGDVLLATNAILMQFVSFSAFFLDGYALASESLIGQAVGRRDQTLLARTIRYAAQLGLLTAALLSLAFWIVGPAIIDLLTNVTGVRIAAREYLPWVIAAPVLSLWCYLLDGIFIGATRTGEMRNAMIFSLVIYLLSWQVLTPILGNHGLWLSLQVYFLGRAGSLYFYLPRVRQAIA